jgi:methyltransferase (TIGR00027 family)
VDSDPSLSALGSTAVAVAACRAFESARLDRWFYDVLAMHIVDAGAAQSTPLSRGLVAWVAVRTRFLDELVTAAAARGVRQIVIVGAGLDARVFRLALPAEATVFEVDHAEIVSFKQRLLDELQLVSGCRRLVVVADVTGDDWLQRLADAGWTQHQPTAWVVEGLLIYLTWDERSRLVEQLAAASGVGSVLGATLSTWTGDLSHPLWHPAAGKDPVEWLLAAGWDARLQTMADASAAFGRPIPEASQTNPNGRLVHATPTADRERV